MKIKIYTEWSENRIRERSIIRIVYNITLQSVGISRTFCMHTLLLHLTKKCQILMILYYTHYFLYINYNIATSHPITIFLTPCRSPCIYTMYTLNITYYYVYFRSLYYVFDVWKKNKTSYLYIIIWCCRSCHRAYRDTPFDF